MPVNGGAGNAISLSEVQTFYGGSNPISMSEYYRGGDQVPDTAVDAASASGTASDTTENVAVTVATETGVTTIGSGYGGAGTNFTIDTGTAGGSTVTVTMTVSTSDDFQSVIVAPSGPTVFSGGNGTWTGSDGVSYIIFGPDGSNGSFSYPQTNTVYDLTITNNTGQTLDMTMSPWADDSSFTDGEVATADNQSSNSWSWSHPAVSGSGNTNVPTSGTINMDVFNAPGTPAP